MDKSFPITQVLPNAVSAHADFLRTLPNDLPAFNPRVSSRAMWIPTPHLMFKVNFDGAVFKEENKASIGVVIWDDLGQVMASMSENISLPSSVDEIETPATVRALNFSQEVGFSSIILECDFERVINSWRREETSFSSFGHLLEDAKVLAESFAGFIVSHVKRQGNSIVHNLARYAKHVSDLKVWMKSVPSRLNAIIVADFTSFL